jgi:hypothetical protein
MRRRKRKCISRSMVSMWIEDLWILPMMLEERR